LLRTSREEREARMRNLILAIVTLVGVLMFAASSARGFY
jgi:hypothetical protein